MKKIIYFFILVLIITQITAAQIIYPFSSATDAEKFKQLTNEIRCVVCQNQSLAESSAPLAKDLRKKIYQMVLEKKSESEIKNYLRKRYGDFILLRPEMSKKSLLLWGFPFLGLVTFLIVILFFIA